MSDKKFEELLQEKTQEAEKILGKYLPEVTGEQSTVLEAMNYSLLAGGKRLRPILMMEAYRLFGGHDEIVEPFMAAIEMIHTYSLVHDDLPAMDNDELRRGKHTTWKVYGEAMGILAGDALLNYAFETAAKSFEMCATSRSGRTLPVEAASFRLKACADAVALLAGKAGIYGMVGGQVVDVEAEKQHKSLSGVQLLFVHEQKTAALIQASLMTGAVLAGAAKAQIGKLEQIGRNVGIAFQIQDDILDVIGDTEELGKTVGSDAASNKETYVTMFGIEKSKADVEGLTQEALEILGTIQGEKAFLEKLILSLTTRRK